MSNWREATVHSFALHFCDSLILGDEEMEFLGGVFGHADLIFLVDEVSEVWSASSGPDYPIQDFRTQAPPDQPETQSLSEDCCRGDGTSLGIVR